MRFIDTAPGTKLPLFYSLVHAVGINIIKSLAINQ
jgi:hypothetical protein